ncbi:MAG: NADP-dependent isocitrate dehydrogenase [Clostridia bacterium]|nr:NADP-dependent isocitrate dehydrogenase [Clostridia bacterium]
MDRFKEVFDIASKHSQTGLLAFWESLDEAERDSLGKEILNIDFAKMEALYAHAEKPVFDESATGDVKPIEVIKAPQKGCDDYDTFEKTGLDVIKNGGVVAITLAGGQGSRLGHDGPKGTYNVGFANGKTIFEIQLDGLFKLHEKTGTFVHWYIMTSDTNHDDTVSFFREHGYFGYPEEKISFFRQNMIPVVSRSGSMLLRSKSEIFTAPDGNGGILSALKSNGILEEGDGAAAKYVFVNNVDNILNFMCDPLFIGAIETTGKDCLTKTFMKRSADEKAGVYCLKDGKAKVVEYTEVPADMANALNPDGSFMYGDANAGVYVFRADSLKKALDSDIPFHTYVKKVNFIDNAGIEQETEAYKFEMFLFDVFGMIGDVAAYRVDRDREFAPVKNKAGNDSPASARELYRRVHKIAMNRIVEMDGDEMTRVVWQKIKEKILEPYVDLNTEYYDLGIMNRDATDDKVTVEAANAIKRLGVGVKCATITPNAARVEEYGLKKMWRSPNATLRGILDGTVFRKPITVDVIKPLVRSWKKPIVIARHAYGDVYAAAETVVEKGSKASLTVEKPDGSVETINVHEFTNSDGILSGYFNETGSIRSFAVSCFEYALDSGIDLWFSCKDTVSKTYEAAFRKIFDTVYEENYREKFEKAGITYFYTLVDDAISRVMKSEGGFCWACRNYDGDVFSDMLASGFGSLSMMTSVLVSPDGCCEFEAAHGTVPRHYKKYLAGESTSTNPIATLFAWTGALKKRGTLDGNGDLIEFALRVEHAALSAVSEGIMTGDLASIADCDNIVKVDLDGFLDAVNERIFKLPFDEVCGDNK